MERQQLFFEDVKEGDEAPPLIKGRITRTDIVRFAGASGDFARVHHDDVEAHRLGHERVFAMGMMSAGYLSHLATDWLGDGNLHRFKVRFATRIWPGDTLTCKGIITKKYTVNDENLVDCDVWVENQRGEKVTLGWITAALTSKG